MRYCLKTVNCKGKINSIDYGAFYYCDSLDSFDFGNDIVIIEDYAFLNTALTSATLPNSLTTIGDHALGFNYKNSTYIKTDGFTIKGAAGSAAETYAEENGFEFIKTEFPLVNNSTVSAETIALGEKVTLTAKAEGGTAPYTYALMYKKASASTWSKIGEKYGTKSTGSFKPGAAVPYDVMINVKDSTGKIVSKSFKITVNTGSTLKNTSTVLSLGLIYGEDLCVIPKAEGGTAPYKMIDYGVKETSDSEWEYALEQRELTGKDEDDMIKFRFGSIGFYDFKIIVGDSSGKTAEKIFNDISVEPLV